MKIAVTGGTGFIGAALVPRLVQLGHLVTVFTRERPRGPAVLEGVAVMLCDTTSPGPWQTEIAGHDAVINLAGASIFRRWTEDGKALILNSRLLTTRNVAEAIGLRRGVETHLLSVSGVGYYGHRGDGILREDSAPGDGFLARLAVDWESAALESRRYGAKVVVCRLGHVLGASGGMLPQLVSLSKRHFGGYWGDGRQWVSWVHLEDILGAFIWLLEHRYTEGPVNVTAPNPVRNAEMMKTLNGTLHSRPFLPSVPGWMLKLATGEFASVFLGGQRVMPARLLEAGFAFRFVSFQEAVTAEVRTLDKAMPTP
jgi:uncharacterized protein (TIGR01777 family)